MKTFEEICVHAADQLKNDRTILYEMPDWMADIMCEYNRLGFLTHVSQPGREYDSTMYKSTYHRYRDRDPKNILDTVIRKQRAYVRGYMHKSMANVIYDLLSHDKQIFIRTTDNNRPATFDILFGSVHFRNNKPVARVEEPTPNNFEETKSFPDANWSFNFNLPLRRPISSTFGEQYPEIDFTDIVEVDILDIRWNENDHLWTTLLRIIRDYASSH